MNVSVCLRCKHLEELNIRAEESCPGTLAAFWVVYFDLLTYILRPLLLKNH